MTPTIAGVNALENFTVRVRFSNGEEGVLDMKSYLDFGVFRQLNDPVLFEQVRLSFDTIEWPGGIDLDPEFVYQTCREMTPTGGLNTTKDQEAID